MNTAYLLILCRVVIASLYALSSISKMRGLTEFYRAIERFQLLPGRWSVGVGRLLLAMEVSVVGAMIFGGVLLLPGFVLATSLLAVFSVALMIVLIRRQRIVCRCFGRSDQLVSPFDLARNGGFVIFSMTGSILLLMPIDYQIGVDIVDALLIGLIGITLVTVLSSMSDIISLWQLPDVIR